MESDPGFGAAPGRDDELVEKMARAMWMADWPHPVEERVPFEDTSWENQQYYRAEARAALSVARAAIKEECARVAEADAKKSGWLVAAQLGLTEDEQKQFNQSAAKALEIAAAIRAME
jgi:hypothetical protein